VTVDGVSIINSPFSVVVLDGEASSLFSYIAGGSQKRFNVAGVGYFFEMQGKDIYGNEKQASLDVQYVFSTSGSNGNVTGSMILCNKYQDFVTMIRLSSSIQTNAGTVCIDAGESVARYFGYFVPTLIGETRVSVLLVNQDTRALEEIENSPITVVVVESYPYGLNSQLSGALYESVAGVLSYIQIQLYDGYKNIVTSGDFSLRVFSVQTERIPFDFNGFPFIGYKRAQVWDQLTGLIEYFVDTGISRFLLLINGVCKLFNRL
jgi:hypothetical protein